MFLYFCLRLNKQNNFRELLFNKMNNDFGMITKKDYEG